MVAKVNHTESHMIASDTMYLSNHIVFERDVFLVIWQAGDQGTPKLSSNKYVNLYNFSKSTDSSNLDGEETARWRNPSTTSLSLLFILKCNK